MIELIIVVLIVSIISVIAIPNLLQARRTANEASAIRSTSLMFRSEMVFKMSYGEGEFTDITGLYDGNFIDSVLGTGAHIKSGYIFEIDVVASAPGVESSFDLRARPVRHVLVSAMTATGGRDFGINEGGAIYQTVDNTPVNFDGVTRLPTGTAAPVDSN